MQGVLHDKLVMIGRVRFRDLNNFWDNYKRRQSKHVAIIVITVGGDVSPDSSYGNLCRELSEPGKERVGLFYGEGVKDSKIETNYELYIVTPSLKTKLTELHSRESELQDLSYASGPQCTSPLIACIYCLYLLPLFAAVFAAITPPDEHYLTSSSSLSLSVLNSTSDVTFLAGMILFYLTPLSRYY